MSRLGVVVAALVGGLCGGYQAAPRGRPRRGLWSAPAALEVPPAAAPERGAVAAWHAERRALITRKVGRGAVDALRRPTPLRTLGALACANAAQVWLAVHCASDLWLLAACTVGGWLSLVQFACLHDVLHGGADVSGLKAKDNRALRRSVLFVGSQPSAFGYWLYLSLGHLTHHANTGDYGVRDLFESAQLEFEDGDSLFVAHRQETTGANDDPAISISRFSFRNAWVPGNGWVNAAAYCASALAERAALFCNDKVVAATGRNGVFFPNKPDAFHAACAGYARFSAVAQGAVFLAAGCDARVFLYLVVAETAWQLPFFPAAALFVSNHGALDDATPPTRSVYGGGAFDALCVAANYHTEHHDFPDVPLWRLAKLRALAGPEFYPDSPPWHTVIADAFRRPVTYKKWTRAELPQVGAAKTQPRLREPATV